MFYAHERRAASYQTLNNILEKAANAQLVSYATVSYKRYCALITHAYPTRCTALLTTRYI